MSSPVWLHCNKCVDFKKQRYFLTQCEHLFCERCAQHSAHQKRCLVCNASISKMMPLDADMPPEIRKLFEKDQFDQMPQILDFQNKQWDHLLEHHRKQVDSAEKELANLKKTWAKQQDEEAHLMKQLQAWKEEKVRRQRDASSIGHAGGRMMDFTAGSSVGSAGSHPSVGFPFSSRLEVLHSRGMPNPHNSLFSLVREGSSHSNASSSGAIPKKYSRK